MILETHGSKFLGKENGFQFCNGVTFFADDASKRFYPVKQFGMVFLSDEQGSQMLTLRVTHGCVLTMSCYIKHFM